MSVQMGTFGSFTTARLAIYASQSSLNVTGNNIANINTKGYTRQRMDLVSLYPTGEARYANNYNLSIGYGVLCDSVSQLRDPFLDIRYRNENASAGAYESRLEGLRQLSHKLDEVGKGEQGFGVIEDQLADFIQQLQSWNNETSIVEYDNLVRASADQLCKLFNTTAQGLQEVFENEEKYLETNVAKANSLLTQIRDLNEQIRAHNIYGNSALELKDARNVAIDELSSLMKINVTYSMEKIDEFTEVEKLTITLPGTKDPAISKAEAQELADAENQKNGLKPGDPGYKTVDDYTYSSNFGKPIKLIDGIYGTQLNIKKNYTENPKYQGKYLTAEGVATDDAEKAAKDPNDPTKLVMNPDHQGKYFVAGYDPNDPATHSLGPYGNGTTDDENEAKDPANGNVTNNPDYQMKYLDAYGLPTDDIDLAAFEYDDKYLMDLSPLVDRRGKYMRDPKYGNQLTSSTDLKDNDLYGALQSMRELLTEEGEFTSLYELGKDLDKLKAEDPEEYERALLYADENASTKRGIPYYMKTLDLLAQQFAKAVNEINQPNKYVTGIDSKGQPIYSENGTLTYDMIYGVYQPKDGEVADYSKVYKTGKNPANPTDTNDYFLDKDGNPITDANGNKIQPSDVQYANLDENTLAEPFASMTDAELGLTNPTDDELRTARLAAQSAAITAAKDNLAVLEQNGVKDATFVDKEGNTINITAPVLDANGNPVLDPVTGEPQTETRPMTLADVQDATLDPTKPENYEKIKFAQENLEKLREEANLTDEWNFYNGGALLSNNGNNNDPTGITASNISVALDWGTGSVRVLNTVQPNEVEILENGQKRIITHTTESDNIQHMISSLELQRNFDAKDIAPDSASKGLYYKGSFQEMFTNMAGTLATDTNETMKAYNNFELTTLDLENDRQSVSGVDLNEEATSMMQFQKSFSAACQLLTIIDSMLDKLINGTI